MFDYKVDEEMREYDEDELAFHHVVTFVVTFERHVENYDDPIDDHFLVQWTMNRHSKFD
jgi:hypothetical protein